MAFNGTGSKVRDVLRQLNMITQPRNNTVNTPVVHYTQHNNSIPSLRSIQSMTCFHSQSQDKEFLITNSSAAE